MSVANALSFIGPCQCQENELDVLRMENTDVKVVQKNAFLLGPSERGVIRYMAALDGPLMGIPLRIGQVHYMQSGRNTRFQPATLALYVNGFTVNLREVELGDDIAQEVSIAWSPFCLVQACRLHSEKADLAVPWMRLFKVSVFHHGSTHFFAVEGANAELERTRWVADLSRALRSFTQSLFVPYGLCVEPIPGNDFTGMRILAGYLLKCDKKDVLLVYGELHAQQNGQVQVLFYEDAHCSCKLFDVVMDEYTQVSEHVAVDCSCFTLDCHHFAARSSAERALWLRAISNLKVKLRHTSDDPTAREITAYRASILECARSQCAEDTNIMTYAPMLPKRRQDRLVSKMVSGDRDVPKALNGNSVRNIVPLGESLKHTDPEYID
jgi:hypothetical protein